MSHHAHAALDAGKTLVSLTFDDGRDEHLDVAMPLLEEHGLRGTFYVNVGSEAFTRRHRDWPAAAARGHELGNHTVFHPGVSSKAWVTPGIALDITAHDMTVASAKQLWPWFAARNARSWVLENVFGGRLAEASIQYRVVPGRIGNGVPLSASEVSVRFALVGSRFDTASRSLPFAMRSA